MPYKANPIIAMLKADHKKVKGLFAEYEEADAQKQRTIAQNALQELDIHAELEERLIYPAIRDAINDDAIMNEADEEHHVVHILVDELKRLEPSDEIFKAKFVVLSEVVKHHVKEEEGEVLPKAQKTEIDWEGLHKQVMRRKEQLMERAA